MMENILKIIPEIIDFLSHNAFNTLKAGSLIFFMAVIFLPLYRLYKNEPLEIDLGNNTTTDLWGVAGLNKEQIEHVKHEANDLKNLYGADRLWVLYLDNEALTVIYELKNDLEKPISETAYTVLPTNTDYLDASLKAVKQSKTITYSVNGLDEASYLHDMLKDMHHESILILKHGAYVYMLFFN